MRSHILLAIVALGLIGCVRVDRDHPPAQASTTVVTPAPQATYVAPPTTTTVVRP